MSLQELVLILPRKIVKHLETSEVPLFSFIGVFFAALILRNFIEAFTQKDYNYLNADNFHYLFSQLHANLSITSGAIALVILFHLATKVEIVKIIKVVAPCFLLLLITPLIDYIVSGGEGFNIMYLGAIPFKDLLTLYISFFNSYRGFTPGMTVELICVLYLSFSYFLIKGRSVIFSLIYTWMTYTLIFVYFTAPLIVKFFMSHLGLTYEFSAMTMLRFYLIITVFLLLLLLFLHNRTVFILIAKDMRWSRITHYILMVVLGVVIALNTMHINLLDVEETFWCNFLFATISLLHAGLFSIITNNIADLSIDRISNLTRPLVTQKISLPVYKNIAIAAFLLAVIYGFAAGFKILYIILTIIATYFLYSMSPTRLKKIPVVSKLTISYNSLVLVFAGYLLVTNSVINFPKILIPIFLCGFTLAANFIDIKDIRGDKANNITTLPILIGINATKFIVSIAFILIYLSFYYIHPTKITLYLLFLGAIGQIYIIYNKNNDEKLIFSFYLFCLTIFIAILRI